MAKEKEDGVSEEARNFKALDTSRPVEDPAKEPRKFSLAGTGSGESFEEREESRLIDEEARRLSKKFIDSLEDPGNSVAKLEAELTAEEGILAEEKRKLAVRIRAVEIKKEGLNSARKKYSWRK